MSLWHIALLQPLTNVLMLLYRLFFNNMGLAIIGLTFLIRFALVSFTSKQLEAAQAMKKLAPELEKLKKKYKDDKQKLAQAQLELYKKHGVNPASGCLPTIIQFVILIALFQVLNQVLQGNGEVVVKTNEILYSFLKLPADTVINTRFLYLDITKPDTFILSKPINIFFFKLSELPGLFLLAAAGVQFLSSRMMMVKTPKLVKPEVKDKKETEDMAQMMQSQMLYLAPVMTLVIGFRFASGLVLYWLTFSVFMIIQQIIIKKKSG